MTEQMQTIEGRNPYRQESDIQKAVVAAVLVITSLVIGFGAGSSIVDEPQRTTVEIQTSDVCTQDA